MLKYLSIRLKGELLSLVFLLFFSCFLSTANAQVTIKEKIELNGLPENKINKGFSIVYADSVVSGFIMPKSGILECYYSYLTHFYRQMPDYSSLNSYFFKGDSLKNDSLINRFYLNNAWQRNYQFCYPNQRMEYDCLPVNYNPYNIGNVMQGDTVQFTYLSDIALTGEQYEYGVYDASEIWVDSALVGWDILFGYFDYCTGEFDNVLSISIGVMKWDSLYVKVQPDTIYPGGTAQVVIKKRLPDGTLTDFDSTQTYEIGMLDGCILGNIVAGTDSGSHLVDVPQPIYFVADTSVDTTGIVLLRVGLVGQTYKPQNKYNLKKDLAESDCFFGWVSESYIELPVFIDEPIAISWEDGNHLISSVPEMPSDLSIWVRPKLFCGPYFLDWTLEVKWVSKDQEPDKIFSYTFHNQTFGYSVNGVQLELPGTDETIVGGDELKLTVRYSDDDFPNGVTVTKKLTGTKILGTNDESNVQVVNNYINDHDFPAIDLPLSEPVSLEDQRKQMQKIVEMESSHFQFFDIRYTYKRHGPEDVGYPNTEVNEDGVLDWGLCQIHKKEPSLGVIWNWKENINAGIHFLWVEKYEQLKRDYNGGGFYEIKEKLLKEGIEVRNLNRKEFLLWLTQRYHGGQYYKDYIPAKKDKAGYWEPNPNHHDYGHKFCILFGGWDCDDLK
ncbi:MAG TPA: hypothetical protein VLB50_10195 [Ignavibacteriaceae bacterium]|nr:hypothetical protein [Ignavibacteriaceae bacterium]